MKPEPPLTTDVPDHRCDGCRDNYATGDSTLGWKLCPPCQIEMLQAVDLFDMARDR